jgi:hypothetical protein
MLEKSKTLSHQKPHTQVAAHSEKERKDSIKEHAKDLEILEEAAVKNQ